MYGHGHGSYLEEIMLMKCLITSVCLLVDLADLCTVSHANFVFAMMQYPDWRHRSGAWVSWLKYWNILSTFMRKWSDWIEMKSWKWRGSKKLHLMLVLAGQWTWYLPDKCQTAAVPLGITRYPYHGHHQSEIKHLSGHSFTRPRHWRLGTSG